ncbi:MotE family protein [Arenibacterium sp. CAU 1754]
MTRKSTGNRRTGFKGGALFWVAILLCSSAILRFGLAAGPAIAREAARKPEPQTEAGQTSHPSSIVPAGTSSDLEPLLRALQSREQALVLREKQVEDRTKALEIAGAAIDRKMAALIKAEESLSATLVLADGASENDLSQLTAVYEKMKPKESAALFEAMDPGFAAGFLARMRSDAAAGIMAKLSPEAAYSISVILAGRNATVPTK